MDVNQLMQQTRDALTVSRLFGEPHERNGVTVIPVAVVRGGGGGGQGEGSGPEGVGTGSGSGGGFGLAAKPAGAYVIEGNQRELATGGGRQPHRSRRSSRDDRCLAGAAPRSQTPLSPTVGSRAHGAPRPGDLLASIEQGFHELRVAIARRNACMVWR